MKRHVINKSLEKEKKKGGGIESVPLRRAEHQRKNPFTPNGEKSAIRGSWMGGEEKEKRSRRQCANLFPATD